MGIESHKRHNMSDSNTLQKHFNFHKRKIKTASYLNSSNNRTVESPSSVMKQKRAEVYGNDKLDVELLQGGGK